MSIGLSISVFLPGNTGDLLDDRGGTVVVVRESHAGGVAVVVVSVVLDRWMTGGGGSWLYTESGVVTWMGSDVLRVMAGRSTGGATAN